MLIDPPDNHSSISSISSIETIVRYWAPRLNLPEEEIWITTSRQTFQKWRGRPPRSTWGCYSPPLTIKTTSGKLTNYMKRKLGDERAAAYGKHIIYLNLPRIRNIEVVLLEELIHARDFCLARSTGRPMRKHTCHGDDEIAREIASLLGITLVELRDALVPRQQRPVKYHYKCPACARIYPRRRLFARRSSCSLCDPRGFNAQYELSLELNA